LAGAAALWLSPLFARSVQAVEKASFQVSGLVASPEGRPFNFTLTVTGDHVYLLEKADRIEIEAGGKTIYSVPDVQRGPNVNKQNSVEFPIRVTYQDLAVGNYDFKIKFKAETEDDPATGDNYEFDQVFESRELQPRRQIEILKAEPKAVWLRYADLGWRDFVSTAASDVCRFKSVGYCFEVLVGGKPANTSLYNITWKMDPDVNSVPIDLNEFKNKNQLYYPYYKGITFQSTADRVHVDVTDKATGALVGTDSSVGSSRNIANKSEVSNGWDSGLGWVLKSLIGLFIAFVLDTVNYIYANIILPITQVVLSIEPHTQEFSQVILQAWLTVRNLMNVVIILALIVVALSMLFQIKSADYKKLLIDIALTAIFINFSLVFAQLVLGIADTLQAQFLPNNADVLKTLASQLILGPFQNLRYAESFTSSGVASIISAFVYLIFGVTAFFVMGAIAALLMIRIVALWGLMIISPIAYTFDLLKPFSKFTGGWNASKWWGEFLKYAFFTPILGLALTIVAIIAKSQAQFIGSVTVRTFAADNTTNPNLAQFIYNILSNLLIVGLLIQALKLSTKGIEYADKVVKKVEQYANKPKDWGKKGSKALYGKGKKEAKGIALAQKNRLGNWLVNSDAKKQSRFMRGAAKILSPKAAYQARTDRVEGERKKLGEENKALMETLSVYGATGGKINPRKDEDVLDKFDDEAKARHKKQSPKELAEALKAIEKDKSFANSVKGQREIRGIFKAAVDNGKYDKFLDEYHGKNAAGESILKTEMGGFNPDTARSFAREKLGNMPGVDRFYNTIDEMARDKGTVALIGLKPKFQDASEYEKEVTGYLDGLADDKLKGLNLDAVPKEIEPGKPHPIYKKFIDLVENRPDLVLERKPLEYLLGKETKIDTNTGEFVFADEEDRKRYEGYSYDLKRKLSNWAIGVTDPSTAIYSVDEPMGSYYQKDKTRTKTLPKIRSSVAKKIKDNKDSGGKARMAFGDPAQTEMFDDSGNAAST
jgi:hypothetical protein